MGECEKKTSPEPGDRVRMGLRNAKYLCWLAGYMIDQLVFLVIWIDGLMDRWVDGQMGR